MENYEEGIITEDQKNGKKDFSCVGLAYFSLLAITITCQLLINTIIFNTYVLIPRWLLYVIGILPMYLLAAPVCILIFQKIPASGHLECKKWEFKKLLLCFMIAVGVSYLGNFLSQIIVAIGSHILGRAMVNPAMDFVMNTNMVINIIIVVIIAPIIEEILFRKVLLDRICVYGEGTAVLVSGLTFALFHGNLFQVLYAFLLGIIFAYVYVKTKQIKYCIGLHMAINFLGSVVSVMLLNGVDIEALNSGRMEFMILQLPRLLLILVYGFAMFSCMIASIVVIICQRKKIILNPGATPVLAGKRFRTIFLNAGMILFFCGCGFLFYFNTV